jgi:hypothetical protein
MWWVETVQEVMHSGWWLRRLAESFKRYASSGRIMCPRLGVGAVHTGHPLGHLQLMIPKEYDSQW